MKSTTKPKAILAFALIALLALPGALQAADDIFLTDGKRLTNVEIKKATYEVITYIPAGVKREQTVAADKVRDIEWRPSNNRSLPRGVAAYRDGRLEDALKRLKGAHALANGPAEGYAKYMYGKALIEKGKSDRNALDDGLTVLLKFVKENASSKDFYLPKAQIAIAEANLQLQKYSEAEKAYTALGGYGSKFKGEADMGRGRMALVKKDFSGARGIFSRLTKDSSLGERQVVAWIGYARAQLGLSQHQGAADTARDKIVRSARLKPEAAQGYLVWGEAELAMANGNKDKLEWAAIRFLRAASLSGMDRATYLQSLEGAKKAFEAMGQKGRAENLGQRIAKLK